MNDQPKAYDEYRLLSLNGPIDENEYTVLSLGERIELKERIEGNVEAYEFKLLLPSLDELIELTNVGHLQT